jgi:hypothetical protein
MNLALSYLTNRFLLAKIQLDVVLRGEVAPVMRSQLKNLPKSPSESYMKGLERIKEAKPLTKAAIHALAWIYHAKSKLKMEQLLDAVGLTTNTTDDKFEPSNLTDMCRGLVFYDKSSGIVQFIHSTVETFLNQCFDSKEAEDTRVVKHDIINALKPYFLDDVDLGKACLTYLSLNIFDNPCPDEESLKHRMTKYKFSEYVARHWRDHIRGVVETDCDVRDAIFKAFRRAGKRKSMEQIADYREGWGVPTLKDMSLLHFLVKYGVGSICMYLLSDDTSNTKNAYVFHSPPS